MTITDVAERAATSVASVSRVINGQDGVSTRTAARIREVMREMGYVPPSAHSRFRRSPRKRQGIRTGTVAFLVPDTDSAALRTVLMGHVLHGIEPELKRHGVCLQLASLATEGTPPDFIGPGKVDGVIVRCCAGFERLDERLRDVPHVWLFETDQPPRWGDQITPNNQLVGQYAARFLLSRGRRRWGYLGELGASAWSVNRGQAFVQAAHNLGVDVRQAQDNSSPAGTLDALLASGWNPDGIFYPSDEMQAPAIYQILRQHDLEPGRDVDVICCGHDENRLRMLNPPLASVDIRPDAMGAAAVEMLLWRMANPNAPRRQLAIEPKLVVIEAEPGQQQGGCGEPSHAKA